MLIVALVTSINDFSKERQFQELNKVATDRKSAVLSSPFLFRFSIKRAVSVIRSGKRNQINVKEIVVGDVVALETGDSIPADGLVLTTQGAHDAYFLPPGPTVALDLHVDESSMSGEGEAVEKRAKQAPFLLSNCKVMTGGGLMLVVAVGPNTQWGRIKAMLDTPVEDTPLQVPADQGSRIVSDTEPRSPGKARRDGGVDRKIRAGRRRPHLCAPALPWEKDS